MMKTTNIGCAATICARKTECALFANYQRQLAEDDNLHILNPEKTPQTAEGCDAFTIAVTQRFAYGFKALVGTIPRVNVSRLRGITDFTCRTTYYRHYRGEQGLSPEEQTKLLDAVRSLGGDPNVPFDRYQDELVYVRGA